MVSLFSECRSLTAPSRWALMQSIQLFSTCCDHHMAQNFHRKHIHHLAAQNMAESQFAYFYQVQKFILHWQWHTIERFHLKKYEIFYEKTLDNVLLWCFTVTSERQSRLTAFCRDINFSWVRDDRWRSQLSSLETWQPLVLSVWTGPEIFPN